jgi:hypothetical protein
MQPAVGAKVGRFTLMRPLETNAQRVIWLGSHEAFGTMELAAIDLPLGDDPDPARAAALRRESEVAQHLQHAGIQRVLEVGELDGQVWIAREHVEGTTLDRLHEPLEALRTSDDPLRLACVAHILGSILDVLAHTHGILTVPNLPLGVTHGQLTARDVLVSTHGTIKIAGFGLDRRPSDGTAGLMNHDGLRSMAPEQLHRPELTPSTDLYAIGIVLHTLLDGQPPWPALGGVDLYRALLTNTAAHLEHPVPAELEAARAALLAPQGQRVGSAGAAAQMVRQWSPPRNDASKSVADLVRRVLAPVPSQDAFDLASQTSSELRPISGSPPAPVAPFTGGPPSLATPSGPPASLPGPAPLFTPPASMPGPAPLFTPSASAPGPAHDFRPPPSVAGPATPSTPPNVAPPSIDPRPAAPAQEEGTAMIDPEMLARMREAARQASRAGAPATPARPAAVAPTPAPASSSVESTPGASARPSGAAGVVHSAPAPQRQPAMLGSTGAAHRPAPVVVTPPPPKRPAAPASSAPARPSRMPAAAAFEPAPGIGEGTTTAMLVRRERRSMTLILVGGALVSIILGVVVAYLVFL